MVSFNLGGLGSNIFGWFSSILTWALVLLFVGGLVIIVLVIKKRLKYRYPCIELVGLGQGKMSIYNTKAGWFKKRTAFFGLIETGGEQQLKCKDGKRTIHSASSVDYHEINGKRGIICKRKDDDPEVLVPLSRIDIENNHLLMRIAPADFRDAAVEILEDKRKETMTWLEKNAPMIVAIGVFAFGLIALIIIFNFAKGESTAWREYAEAARTGAQIVSSTTAP